VNLSRFAVGCVCSPSVRPLSSTPDPCSSCPQEEGERSERGRRTRDAKERTAARKEAPAVPHPSALRNQQGKRRKREGARGGVRGRQRRDRSLLVCFSDSIETHSNSGKRFWRRLKSGTASSSPRYGVSMGRRSDEVSRMICLSCMKVILRMTRI